jgi:hypothetical protein
MEMASQNGSALCTQCALCCDGSLFMNARLQPRELENTNTLGMAISSNIKQPGFVLPCHLLKEKHCTIYNRDERPRVCSSFQCKLLNRYLIQEVDLDAALSTVLAARNLLMDLQRLTPIGSNQRMTLRNIRLITAYLLSLPQKERLSHAEFLDAVTQYIRMIARDFVYLEPSMEQKKAQVELISV